ncbi:MAG: amino acid transporter [Bryobacterales bacterium]|nr:amino acid transporter [Bryobacterales bacterium]
MYRTRQATEHLSTLNMIDTTVLPLFLAAVATLLIVPGPDFVLISAQSVSRGARYGIACALGIFLAGVLQTALVAVGLGKVMEAWPAVATAVRLGGAAYLAYLGVRLLLSWHRRRYAPEHVTSAPTQSAASLLFVGLVNNLLNPKALLFFSVFIPQFVNPSIGDATAQIAIWGGMLSLLALGYNVLLSLLFSSVRSFRFNLPRLQAHGQGILGILFVALAARLTWAKAA